MKHFVKYFLFLWILAAACTSDEFKPADNGLDYFPVTKGFYQVYHVDSTGYSEVGGMVKSVFDLKVEVVDSFPNPEGTYTFVINRYKRTDANSSWKDYDTWSIRPTGQEVVVSEGNLPFVKLIFPVKANRFWDGNKFNSQAEDEYEISEVNQSYTAGGTRFENTVIVEQEDNEDFIVFLDKRLEVYAREAGLIYKETTQLNYCTAEDCLGQQIIKSGTIYKQEIFEYGIH